MFLLPSLITRIGKPTVTNLNIDADGVMEPGLPMEFFGADIIEGYGNWGRDNEQFN